ncbi:Mbov_0121 family peptidase domain-containing ABC transporter [Mycoplasmopsis gallinarum]|uniref:ABC transporter ATP-binding and permease protein n=1 Tax=Mycoplasmopsis gallinarum TaxID=29557 RepID=A0A168RKF8_9BACT|nr:cysteine peptidase family C39 domain-containing protein [Mycoplasmopsis gallinarum]OAB49064.1 ABC transporter ATP-binding and permease protein [Mycoplasmopsis gallinarum]
MKITKQNDIKDCGLHVLKFFIKKLQNKDVDINYLKINSSYNENGINLFNLKELAKKFELNMTSYSCDFEILKSLPKDDFPIGVLINRDSLNHYLIIKNIDKTRVHFYDSATGKIEKLKHNEFKNIFQNVVFTVEKEKKWTKNENYKLSDKTKDLLIGNKLSIFYFLLAILNLILIFTSTFFVKIIFDVLLKTKEISILLQVFACFLSLNIIKIINSFVKNVAIKKEQNKIEWEITKNFIQKINSLSVNNLSKLTKSDLLRRYSYISFIAQYKANFIYLIFSQLLAFIISSLLMIWVNFYIFLLVCFATGFQFSIDLLINFKIKSKTFNWIKSANKKLKTDLDLIELSKQNKNDEELYFWNNKLYIEFFELKKSDFDIFKFKETKNIWKGLLINNLNLFLILFATFLIFKNEFSMGDLLISLTLIPFISDPVILISDLVMENNLYSEFISDINFVFNLKSKIDIKEGIPIQKINNIKFNNLIFGYENGLEVLNINNWILNENTQIKGKNGCGKSTLLSLLNNQLDNWQGKIEINEINLSNINSNLLFKKIILLTNNDFFPNLSVIDFLTNNIFANKESLYKNIEKYDLNHLLTKLNINLNGKLIDNGNNLSKGQKASINLLKLFIKKYDLIMLDEVFENIENSICEELKEKIKKFQDEAIFLEISHNKNYIHTNNEVNFESINKIK